MIHETRIVPLDGRPHVSSTFHQYMGDSRGHWEGNTLVVETTNLTDRTGRVEMAEPICTAKPLVLSRNLTRTGPDTLRYEVTIDDPQTWTRPWAIAFPLEIRSRATGSADYACHEGNYAPHEHPVGRQSRGSASKVNCQFRNASPSSAPPSRRLSGESGRWSRRSISSASRTRSTGDRNPLAFRRTWSAAPIRSSGFSAEPRCTPRQRQATDRPSG